MLLPKRSSPQSTVASSAQQAGGPTKSAVAFVEEAITQSKNKTSKPGKSGSGLPPTRAERKSSRIGRRAKIAV
eukprot:611717-Pleurochrysis_carterae.AAC.1